MIEWRNGRPWNERTVERDITPTYTEKDKNVALTGHMPLPGTDVEIVAYPINEEDLVATRPASESSGAG